MKNFESHKQVDVGIIKGAYGVKGYIRVEPLSDVPERFQIGSKIFLGEIVSAVEKRFWQKDSLILKLDCINDREKALDFKNTILKVDREQVGTLPDGQYYHFQILHMNVQSENGDEIGEIIEILSTGTNDVYVVKVMNSKDILIPAIPEVVLSIDLDSNVMIVRLLKGLVD